MIGTYLGGAAQLGVELRLRPAWPLVLVAVLLFHGLAEELVWRGFLFRHLRRPSAAAARSGLPRSCTA